MTDYKATLNLPKTAFPMKGNLPNREPEIQKSWDEYVEQVGDEIANGTPFFTEALNEILARGQDIF